MLQRSRAHWHGQRSALRTSDQRGLAGVQGIERRPVFAEMRWEPQSDALNMVIFNARVRPHLARPALINGLAPLQPSTIVLDHEESLLVVNDVHLLVPGYFSALLFQEPTRLVGSRTGARVHLSLPSEGNIPRAFTVGEAFLFALGDVRYVVCPDDGEVCDTAHVKERIILDAVLEPGPVPVVVPVPVPIPVGTQVRGAPGYNQALMQGAVQVAQADERARRSVQFSPLAPPIDLEPAAPRPDAAVDSVPHFPRPTPWAYLGDSPLSRLCGRLTMSDIAVIDRWDDLAIVLSSGNVPLFARTPRDMLPPRFEFIHGLLEEAQHPLPPPNQDGWPGVFLAARVYMRAATQGPPATLPQRDGGGASSQGQGGSDLSSSFGARHAQVAFFPPSSGTGQAPGIDSQFNISTRAAAAFVQEASAA